MVEPASEATAVVLPVEPKHPVAAMAGLIRSAGPGTYARLRRFDPGNDPQAALFEIELLLQAAQVAPRADAQHERWALLLHCLAIVRGAHVGRGSSAEPGAVLAKLRFSEARLQQLVEADFLVLEDLMPRLARRLGAAGVAVNWLPLADLILYTDTDQEDKAQTARRRLVSHFLQGQRQAETDTAQANSEQAQT